MIFAVQCRKGLPSEAILLWMVATHRFGGILSPFVPEKQVCRPTSLGDQTDD